ncbi:hypothetical protein JXB41_01885 [Candidatus Woesearchaeota archaeon]|nr:hypothetical protein [Candidatus Woesearchaeota archaeon]
MEGKKRIYLTAELILRYLTGDEELENLIIFKNTGYQFISSDQSLYEALGSVKNKKNFDITKLVKLIEVTNIVSFKMAMNTDRKILSFERVNELRDKSEKQSVEKNRIN